VKLIHIKSAFEMDVNCKCWNVSAQTSRSTDINFTPVDFKLSPADKSMISVEIRDIHARAEIAM
jgi:hypothetical protein